MDCRGRCDRHLLTSVRVVRERNLPGWRVFSHFTSVSQADQFSSQCLPLTVWRGMRLLLRWVPLVGYDELKARVVVELENEKEDCAGEVKDLLSDLKKKMMRDKIVVEKSRTPVFLGFCANVSMFN